VVDPAGRGLGAALADALRARGIDAAVARDAAGVAAAAELCGVVLLHGLYPEADPADAFRCARALAQRAPALPVLVTAQSTGGAFGTTPFDPAMAWAGGVAALARTFAQEHPDAAVKAVDLDWGMFSTDELVTALADEVAEGGPELEVGLGAAGRVTLVDRRRPAQRRPLQLGADDVIVVSGGARGVTAATVIALARATRSRFVLLGRTPLQAEPAEAAGVPDDDAALKKALLAGARARGEALGPKELGRLVAQVLAGREVRATLAALEAAGSPARYEAVDVADAPALRRLFEQLARAWGPVTGLIHGAGVIQDRLIREKTDEQFSQVYRTKIDGLKALLAAAQAPLRLLLCFSSVAARTGNRGQVDYAMANEVLNRVCDAYARRHPQATARSLGWGPWEAGMVTPALKARFEQLGVPLIPLDVGAQMLVDEVAAGPGAPTSVVLGGEPRPEALLHDGAPAPEQLLDLVVSAATHPWLADHTVAGLPVVPVALVAEWFARAAGALRPGAPLRALRSVTVQRGVRLQAWPAPTALSVGAREVDGGLELRLLDARGAALYTARADFGAAPAADPVVAPAAPTLAGEPYGGVLFHGPALQVLSGVHAGPAGASAATRACPLVGADRVDVGGIDAALQLALLWAQAAHGGASLPMAVDAIELHAPGAADGALALRARKVAGPTAEADVSLVRADGRLALALRGVRTVRRPDVP
jgi:NAD(P)-dependent dehydrogenase (short-subunit alcohol dehydrogenase family)